MSVEDFKSCARHTLGDVVDSWDEVVIRPLIEVGHWFRNQDETIKWLFGTVALGAGGSALAWLGVLVDVSAAAVVLPILVAFAGGVGVGTGLITIGECAGQL